jgi:hypothetical protein
MEDAGINSPIQIMELLLFNKIVFASRDTGSLGHRTYLDRSTFHKLYVSDVGEEMSLGVQLSLINPSTLNLMNLLQSTKDGKTIYFTRNNYLDGKKGKDGMTIR